MHKVDKILKTFINLFLWRYPKYKNQVNKKLVFSCQDWAKLVSQFTLFDYCTYSLRQTSVQPSNCVDCCLHTVRGSVTPKTCPGIEVQTGVIVDADSEGAKYPVALRS